MLDTKAVRALVDKQANVWNPIGWEADVANTLRQCADEIDALRGQALSDPEREEYFAMKKKAAEYDTLRAENAAISKSRWELGVQVGRLEIECDTLRADNQRAWNKCAELEIERDTLRELVREVFEGFREGWYERAEKALGN
jgi:hypothetical protein